MAAKQKSSSRASRQQKPGPKRSPTIPDASRRLSSRVSSSSSSGKPGKGAHKDPRRETTSTQNETDAAASRLTTARTNWERVAGAVALASVSSALENVMGDIDTAAQSLAELRSRGYRYGGGWESQLETLRARWPQQRAQSLRLLESERRALQNGVRDVELLLQRANRDAGLIDHAESRITALQNHVNQAERRVRKTFDGVEQQTHTLQSEIKQAQFLLDALDAASFHLLPDEHGISACEAIWVSDPAEPEGLLYLTDARLIFEQKQEVAKKKILFIATEKELIQEQLWESPIGAVEELEAEDKRAFLRRKELLTFRFSERTRETPGDVTLQLKGADNETWRSLIQRVKTGQIEAELFGSAAPEEHLASEIEYEAAQPERTLPTVCPNCSAPLPPIFKGMKQLECDYCGVRVNL